MAKIFQRKNDYQFTDEEQGYTRGAGISWQVNFNKFRELLYPDDKNIYKTDKPEKKSDSIQQPRNKNVIQP
jgi:hypothetical protein